MGYHQLTCLIVSTMKYQNVSLGFVLILLLGATACQQTTLGTQPTAGQPQRNTSAPERPSLKLPLKDPRIVVLKSKRQLELYSDGEVVRTYRIGLGLNPVDDKQRQGDRRTP